MPPTYHGVARKRDPAFRPELEPPLRHRWADDPPLRLNTCERIEEAFGWMKTIAALKKTRYRGLERFGWSFTMAATAYNLIRLPKLMGAYDPELLPVNDHDLTRPLHLLKDRSLIPSQSVTSSMSC